MGITITNSGQGSVVRFRNLGRGGIMTSRVSPLLLDDYSGAAAAYSLRKLRGGYSGPVVRVRRSSDNAETDINFTSAGYIDTAALLSFCGSANGFVTTWYDQSGNLNHATQTTAGNQNKIVNLGSLYTLGTKNAIYFDNGFYTLSSNINIGSDFSYFILDRKTNGYRGMQVGSSISNELYFVQWDSGFFFISKPNGVNTFNYRSVGGSNIYSILQGFSTSNVVNAFWNNNNLALTLINTNGNTNININLLGGLGGGAFRTDQCPVQEIIIYNNSQLANRTAITNNINSFYSIY